MPTLRSALIAALAACLLSCLGIAGASGVFFAADPNLNRDLSPWNHVQIGGAAHTAQDYRREPGGSGTVSIVTDPLGTQGQVYKLMVSSTSNFAALSAQSDRVDLWNNAQSYMGQEGQETWEHFRLLFSSTGDSYKPSPGYWNWIVQHHNDNKYKAFIDSGAIKAEKPELCWGVDTKAKLRGAPATELFMVIRGGDDRQEPEMRIFPDSELLYDHWYDMLVHIVWSHDSQTGLVEWWLDGKQIYSQHVANLWQRPDGTTDHVNFEYSNYRIHAGWNSTIYFSQVKIGATRDAVSF